MKKLLVDLMGHAGRPQAFVRSPRAEARFEVRNAAGADGSAAEVYLYGDVGWDILASEICPVIASITATTINLHINSGGGDVFEGIAIYNCLAAHPSAVNVTIDGLAASIASVIAMAGDKITIASTAMMMIHNAWTFTMGNAAELRQIADLLDKVDAQILAIYKARGKADTDYAALMAAETWFTADEAVAAGLATEVGAQPGAKALLRAGLYAHAPARLTAAADWLCEAQSDLPVDTDTAWDGPAAAERLLDAAGFNGESPDPEKARRGFLAYDASAAKEKGSYKLPFADVVGGQVKALASGIRAAASRIPETDVADSVKTKGRAVLDGYESRMSDQENTSLQSLLSRMRNRLRIAQVEL